MLPPCIEEDRSPKQFLFLWLAPYAPINLTDPPSTRWHRSIVTPAMKFMVRLCNGPGGIGNGCNKPTWFGKRLGSLGIWHKSSQNGRFFLSCTAKNTSLTLPLWWFFLLYGQQWEYYVLPSEPIASLFFVAHTPDFSYIWANRPPTWPLWVPCLWGAFLKAFVLQGH